MLRALSRTRAASGLLSAVRHQPLAARYYSTGAAVSKGNAYTGTAAVRTFLDEGDVSAAIKAVRECGVDGLDGDTRSLLVRKTCDQVADMMATFKDKELARTLLSPVCSIIDGTAAKSTGPLPDAALRSMLLAYCQLGAKTRTAGGGLGLHDCLASLDHCDAAKLASLAASFRTEAQRDTVKFGAQDALLWLAEIRAAGGDSAKSASADSSDKHVGCLFLLIKHCSADSSGFGFAPDKMCDAAVALLPKATVAALATGSAPGTGAPELTPAIKRAQRSGRRKYYAAGAGCLLLAALALANQAADNGIALLEEKASLVRKIPNLDRELREHEVMLTEWEAAVRQQRKEGAKRVPPAYLKQVKRQIKKNKKEQRLAAAAVVELTAAVAVIDAKIRAGEMQPVRKPNMREYATGRAKTMPIVTYSKLAAAKKRLGEVDRVVASFRESLEQMEEAMFLKDHPQVIKLRAVVDDIQYLQQLSRERMAMVERKKSTMSLGQNKAQVLKSLFGIGKGGDFDGEGAGDGEYGAGSVDLSKLPLFPNMAPPVGGVGGGMPGMMPGGGGGGGFGGGGGATA